MAVRVPNTEQVPTPTDQNPVRLTIPLILVREEHDAELTDNRIEAGIRERQGRGVGGPELDHFI